MCFLTCIVVLDVVVGNARVINVFSLTTRLATQLLLLSSPHLAELDTI